MRILVVNAGSSSLKLRTLTADDQLTASRDLPAPRGLAEEATLTAAIREMGARRSPTTAADSASIIQLVPLPPSTQ